MLGHYLWKCDHGRNLACFVSINLGTTVVLNLGNCTIPTPDIIALGRPSLAKCVTNYYF